MTTLEKVGDLTLKVINREKDDMDLKANQRNEMEKTFSSEETQELVAAITFGKGLRNPMPGILVYILLIKIYYYPLE